MVALAKPDNNGVRPIAVGAVLRRLVSKCAMNRVRAAACDHFAPLQVGVGLRGGADAAIHSLRRLLAAHGHDETWVLLQFDLVNAFNLVDRATFMALLREFFPGLSRWVESCYSVNPFLFWNAETFLSCCGVQQDDPLGPLLFALVLQKILVKLAASLRPHLALNVSFLDDGSLAGPIEDVAAALTILIEDGPALGLHLCLPKSLLWWPTMNPARLTVFPPDLRRLPASSGTLFLGAPLGSPDFCDSTIRDRITKICTTLDLLPELDDPQVSLLLLRSCLGFPKMVYSARVGASAPLRALLHEFDRHVHRSLELLVGQSLPLSALEQASWPIRDGGLGLRMVSRHAEAAFLSSWIASFSLQTRILGPGFDAVPDAALLAALDGFNALLPSPDDALSLESLLAAPAAGAQGLLSARLDRLSRDHWLSNADATARIRLSGLCSSLGNAYLSALPLAHRGYHLAPDLFAACLRARLGQPQYPSSQSGSLCDLCGRASLDSQGHHALSCPNGPDRISRHHTIRDVVHRLCTAANLDPVLEAPNLLPDAAGRRPADIFVPAWSLDRGCAFDVTVVSPFVVPRPAGEFTAAFAASRAAQHKIATSAAALAAAGHAFIPLAFECFGSATPATEEALRRLARLPAVRPGVTRSSGQIFADIRRQLSFALQAPAQPRPRYCAS